MNAVPSRRIVVIGGGAAGLLFAVHFARRDSGPALLTILEPRERLGAGVAYSTEEPTHIINVPASRMSADPDDPEAFTRWLARHGDAPLGDERDAYPRRVLFGAYARDFLDSTLGCHPQLQVIHQRRIARDVIREAGRLTVATDEGHLPADVVVLATGNLAPKLPSVLAPLAYSPRCIADPWPPGTLAGVPAEARVFIVGTGLTMGDTVATLRASGHRGPIVALSRRGQIPQRGLAIPATPFGEFRRPPTTARGLLRLARAEIRCAAETGASWYAALAAARSEGWSLWAALPPVEQRRAARHLRRLYELHRHVMPGPIHDLVMAERAAGTLRIVAGSLCRAERAGGAFSITLRPRGTAALRHEKVDVVVNCTGPAYADLIGSDPLWAALGGRGLVGPDVAGIGPAVDRTGHAVGAGGIVQPDLLLVGTLARSAFGELTGIREISLQARLAAAEADSPPVQTP